MSSFNGIIAEYNFISVDYFCDRALQACAFFLSHFHSDHMAGLESNVFFEKLRSGGATLFMHKLTATLMLSDHRYKRLEPFINSWETNVPFLVCSTNDSCAKSATVTLLPGGHCIGSVMLLFEGSEGPVLYTGDERVSLFDWKSFPLLHIDGELKQLTSLYFDSTFCTPHTRQFPSRWEAVKAASKIAADWLKKNSENRILLKCPYQYGYEFLFCQLSKRLKQKIHVNERLLRAYETVADISDCLTDSCDETRLHAFVSLERGRDDVENHKCCKAVHNSNTVLTLRPSVMWFAARKNTKCVKYFTSQTVCHILYSNHSSFDEVVAMVSYLKPKSLYPCVLPNTCSADDFHNFLMSSPLGQFQLKLSGCLRPTAIHHQIYTKKALSRQCSHSRRTTSKHASSLCQISKKSLAGSYVISPASEPCEDGNRAAASSFKNVIQKSAVDQK
ncbi:protein artemis [Trichuris trichiura]|uniref:Protein artemis n=1 Tax=Trichuris trichiura TaxID=36087 RepID=A0A077YX45_TRITR|nr:protein artemis [Trichuris trichiura]